jgi:hypothetical protein
MNEWNAEAFNENEEQHVNPPAVESTRLLYPTAIAFRMPASITIAAVTVSLPHIIHYTQNNDLH